MVNHFYKDHTKEQIMAGGYVGKYCIIDLTTQKTEVVKPGDEFYQKYLAGYGMGAAVLTERQKPGIDPLSPEAHLGFCSGLLSGTGSSFSGRFMIVGKSPLTGGWGDANSGGFLSREIKRTGYDAVFFAGAAQNPTWVYITENGVEFKDATALMGMDNIETNAAIKKELGEKKAQVASIGPAGEKLSLISGVTTDDGRIAARSGLGAVMGSKNLKAVAFRGNLDIPIGKPTELKALNKKLREDYKQSSGGDRFTVKIMGFVSKIIARTGASPGAAKNSMVREIYKKYGTPGLNVMSGMVGDTPIKNWDGVGYQDLGYKRLGNISGDRVIADQKKKYACQNCPLGCGGIIDIKKGRYAGTEGHKTEYETWGAFGGMLLNDEYDSIVECNEMCNRAGLDSISTGAVVAFAVECFENGIIDEEATDGLKLGWGRADEIVKLTEKIINREGIGDLLADGVKIAAQKIGKGAEKYAVHAGGQELPMHDSRLDHGYALAYQCEPTPGRHTISCFQYPHLFEVEKNFPSVKKKVASVKDKQLKDIQRYAAGSFMMQLMNGCGLCEFGPMTVFYPIADFINAATGWNLTADDYLKTGERILSLRKAFNVREGVTPADSQLHQRALGVPAMTRGPLKGVTVDIDTLQKAFFEIVGWDEQTGGPTSEKMKELGL